MNGPIVTLVTTIRCSECGEDFTCPHETHGQWCGCLACPACSTRMAAAESGAEARKTADEDRDQSSLRKGSPGSGSVS